MKAKEMFEKLGYTTTKETKSILEYKKFDSPYSTVGYDRVSFSLTQKSISTTGKTMQGNSKIGNINLDLLKAIIEQTKELDWIE